LSASVSRFVAAGEVRLHYLEWEGAEPALVLAHGTGLCAATWRPFVGALGGRRVLSFDLRGHGDSEKPERGYGTVDLAADVARALARLGLDGPIGIGHSLGAVVLGAVEAAHPGMFRRLVLIDPATGPPASPQFNQRASEMGERTRRKRDGWPSREALLASYRTKETFQDWREDALRAYVDEGTYIDGTGQVRLKCPPAIEAQVFDSHGYHDRWSDLPRLHLPVLLLRGSATHVVGDDLARQILARLPDGRDIVVPGARHFLPMEEPERTAAIVRAFLAEE
jgi:pimeloyl-ACP methyl ester carboxylesterase